MYSWLHDRSMRELETIIKVMPQSLRRPLQNVISDLDRLQEIRLRVGREVCLKYDNREYVLGRDGLVDMDNDNKYIVSDSLIKEMIDYVTNYSLYAVEDELSRGYITINGGHRVGICGHIVLSAGRVKSIRNISSVNLRVAHQVFGCANHLMEQIYDQGMLENTLIISPPGAGKTTLLRDMIRILSNRGYQLGVVDERSEIAAMSGANVGNDLGPRTDILDGCPKHIGIAMLIRSMTPDVIAVDEIGSEDDVKELRVAALSGCKILATAHGLEVDDVRRNQKLSMLMDEGFFRRLIVLTKNPVPGTVLEVYRGESELAYD